MVVYHRNKFLGILLEHYLYQEVLPHDKSNRTLPLTHIRTFSYQI
jgi:hypothetical protein